MQGQEDVALELDAWIDATIGAADNKSLLQQKLASIEGHAQLIRFLHRFLLFNDALAARVPFLAGLIHLTPDLFLERTAEAEFCRQRSARIAAHIAEAASDEYRLTPERNLVHQHLAQEFLRGMLAHFCVQAATFDRCHPVPLAVDDLLSEVRCKFFAERSAEQIFGGLGFHVGLEFFAHEEFNLVDTYLRAQHPSLVQAMEQGSGSATSPYLWLSLHTVVEIRHYRSGLEALRETVRCYPHPDEASLIAARIMAGFNAFIDLQRRFYQAILSDTA